MTAEESGEALIVPCMKCKGSSGKVHIACLHKWISSKLASIDHDGANVHYFRKLECEVCKNPWPDLAIINNKALPIIPVSIYDNPYIMFERVAYAQTSGDASKCRIYLEILDPVVQITMVYKEQ